MLRGRLVGQPVLVAFVRPLLDDHAGSKQEADLVLACHLEVRLIVNLDWVTLQVLAADLMMHRVFNLSVVIYRWHETLSLVRQLQ